MATEVRVAFGLQAAAKEYRKIMSVILAHHSDERVNYNPKSYCVFGYSNGLFTSQESFSQLQFIFS